MHAGLSPLRLMVVSFALAGTIPIQAMAMTTVDDLSDVPANHWAKPALENVMDKHEVLSGYPNNTFKGNKPTSRWEMAAALNSLLASVGKDIARLELEKGDKAQLETLCKLQQDLREQLITLAKDTEALEGRVAVADVKNKEQDTRLGLLEKTQFHGDMTFGALSDNGSRGTGGTGKRGIRDGVSAVGRLRLSIDVPVVEDKPESKIGAGRVQARLIGAFGRVSPLGTQAGNSGSAYPFNLYSRISTDASAYNEGYGTGSVGNQNGLNGNTSIGRPNLFVESMFYSQHFKAGIPMLTDFSTKGEVKKDHETTGDLYAGVVRWWDLFDISPYRGNEMTQFQNNAFINVPGNVVNVTQPMVAYAAHQALGKSASLDLTGAVGTLDWGDAGNGLNVSYEGRLNYTPTFLGEKFSKPGSFYAGGYNVFEAGNRRFAGAVSSLKNRSGGTFVGYKGDSINDKSTINAAYLGWNQEWFKGIGTNVSFLMNNRAPSVVTLTTLQPGPATVLAGARQTFSGVVQIPMTAFGHHYRQKDMLGLGYSMVMFQSDGLSGTQFNNTAEQVAEAYYRWQINDQFAIIPSAQLIVNRLGLKANGPATVLGMRMSYSF
jgi:hypothetical protein